MDWMDTWLWACLQNGVELILSLSRLQVTQKCRGRAGSVFSYLQKNNETLPAQLDIERQLQGLKKYTTTPMQRTSSKNHLLGQ